MSKVPIFFCQSNLHTGSALCRTRLEETFPDVVDIREVACLGLCDRCPDRPYCYLGDMLFDGATPQDLWERIERILVRALEEPESGRAKS